MVFLEKTETLPILLNFVKYIKGAGELIDKKYEVFFKLFQKEEYFECHEILEEVWIEETQRSTKNHPAVVLLQFAVALLHWKRSNFNGAKAVFLNSLSHLENSISALNNLKVDSKKLKESISKAIEEVEKKSNYRVIEIPTIKQK
ncbi:MAG: DUF309 domain-containing protein [Fusobacteriaceae bacterium]